MDKVLLERVQHRFTRMFSDLKELPYKERLLRLGLWSLEERRNRADLIELFKTVKGFSAVSWSHFFTQSDTGITRGHNWKLKRHIISQISVFISFSQRSISIDGTAYLRKQLMHLASTPSRTTLRSFVFIRWTSSWTDVLPSQWLHDQGLISVMFFFISYNQVQPHPVCTRYVYRRNQFTSHIIVRLQQKQLFKATVSK